MLDIHFTLRLSRCVFEHSHTAPLLTKLKLLTVALQELKLYYKFTHNELPAYFQNWQIVKNYEIHTHTTRRQHDIHIVGIKHTFAKRCIRINLPRTLNNTPQIVKDKLLTHSFRGFINYAKFNFLQSYQQYRTVVNCYIYMQNDINTPGKGDQGHNTIRSYNNLHSLNLHKIF